MEPLPETRGLERVPQSRPRPRGAPRQAGQGDKPNRPRDRGSVRGACERAAHLHAGGLRPRDRGAGRVSVSRRRSLRRGRSGSRGRDCLSGRRSTRRGALEPVLAGNICSGVASTLSLPLHEDGRLVGGVNMYASTVQAFAGRIEQLAMLVGAAPTTAVSNADLSFSSRIEAAEAPQQMRDRAIIETAVGWVAGVKGIDVEAAAHADRRGSACGDPRGPGRAGACLDLHPARGLNGPTPQRGVGRQTSDHRVFDRRRGEATRAKVGHTSRRGRCIQVGVGRYPNDPAGGRRRLSHCPATNQWAPRDHAGRTRRRG